MENDMMKMRGGMGMGHMMLAKLVLMVIFVVGGIWVYRMWVATPDLAGDLDNGEIKAVFLDNGQVYFGKIEEAGKDFLLITNPYYLQKQTVLQEPTEEGAQPTTREQLSLTALGGENLQLHGPEKELFVPWNKILYMENLKDDSQVVKLITEDIKNGGTSTDTNSNTNSAQ
jgi:hypothetical protein